MEDKRTRSDYIREIEQLKRVNRHYEKTYNELIKFIQDELEDIERRINTGYKFLGDTKGNYTLRMYLTYRKNALIEVSKKIDFLQRD